MQSATMPPLAFALNTRCLLSGNNRESEQSADSVEKLDEFQGTVPVIAWPDLDPAGLLFGASLPHLTGILAPANPDECLSQHGRDDLYLNQLQQLDALHLPGKLFSLEQAIRKQRKGIDQERMIAERMLLTLWTT